MTRHPTASAAAEPVRARRLRRRLFAVAFIDEFGPIYAVYTLWFNDNGLSAADVSTVFVVWAIVALALEIPSGVLADRVDRRRLLASAFVIRAAGITLWLVWPTLTGVIAGAVLWAVHDALASGSWEALIHDQLRAVGAVDRYGPIMARVGQFSHLGVAVGTLIGAGLLRLDVGLVVLGWLTVTAHGGSTSLVLALPATGAGGGPAAERAAGPIRSTTGREGDRALGRPGAGDDIVVADRWWSTLRLGLARARTAPGVFRLVVAGALLEGLWLVDEYLPLVARAQGGPDSVAPVLILVVWLGLLAGGEIAARRPTLPGPVVGVAVSLGAVLMMAALASGRVWALGLVAVGYAALETTQIITDARLQERTDDDVRATVTSMRGFGSAAVSMLMLAVVGVLADGDDPTPGLYVLLAAIGGAGLLVARWLPRPPDGGE